MTFTEGRKQCTTVMRALLTSD